MCPEEEGSSRSGFCFSCSSSQRWPSCSRSSSRSSARKGEGLTSGLEWTRYGRSCLHLYALGPAPLRPGVRPTTRHEKSQRQDNGEAVTRNAKPRIHDSSVCSPERQTLYFVFDSFCRPSDLARFQCFVVGFWFGGFIFVRLVIPLFEMVAWDAEELAVSFESHELG